MIMKKLFILLVFIAVTASVWAETPWFPPTNLIKAKKTYFELFGGMQQADMRFDSPGFPGLKRNFDPKVAAGFGFRYQVGDYFSSGLYAVYSQNGISLGEENHYSFYSDNFGIYWPVEYHIKICPDPKVKTRLFVQAGPYFSVPVGGRVISGNYTLPMTKALVAPIDYGVEVGSGVRVAVFSLQGRSYIRLKASYFRGFANTYSESELNGTARSINQSIYSVTGKRVNQGLRLIFSIEIPLEREDVVTFTAGGDGKKTYKRFVMMPK
jgi:hypothetical protein